MRSAVTVADPTAAGIRPMLLHHDATSARMSLVPDGALLLAGDAVEIDVEVEAGARLELVEPGGTVAFDMRGGRARWDVRIRVGAGATLTWAGEPFVLAAGARVDRTTRVRLVGGGRLALRECLVLGRSGEAAGAVRQHTEVAGEADRPLLVETLSLDADTAGDLLGPARVVASVLSLGPGAAVTGPDVDRYDLHAGGHLWRRTTAEAHLASLAGPWASAVERAS